MMELGVAYSYLYEKYDKKGEDYIFPFSMHPIRKGQALSGTPIANIQVGEINNEKDIRSFLDYLMNDKGIHIGAGVNRKLHSFKYDIDQIFLKHQSIMSIAKIEIYFDNTINYRSKSDIANYSISENDIIVNFNMNPYEEDILERPNFISMVLGFVDGLDLERYLDFDETSKFCFILNSFTNSLKRIFIEFKYSDGNKLLDTFEFVIHYGENYIEIPLSKMRSKALENISEICFVIHPDDIVEDEGMFIIGNIQIN